MVSKGKEKLWKYLYVDEPRAFEMFVKFTDQKQRLGAIIFEKIRNVFKDNPTFSILDVGCADGTLILDLHNKLLDQYKGKDTKFEFYLLDPSEMMIQQSKKKFKLVDRENVHFITGGIGKKAIPGKLKNKKFDVIIASFIFFWIEDLQKAISQILSLSKRNGKIIFVGFSEKAKLKKKLVKLATGFETESVEAIYKIVLQYPDKFHSIDTQLFHSPFNIPQEFLSRLENESPLSEEDKDDLSFLEFIIRTTWDNLDNFKRAEILESLKQKRSENDFLCKIMEVNVN